MVVGGRGRVLGGKTDALYEVVAHFKVRRIKKKKEKKKKRRTQKKKKVNHSAKLEFLKKPKGDKVEKRERRNDHSFAISPITINI